MVERLTVKFRTRRGSEPLQPPRGKTVRLGSSTHVHTWPTWPTRRRAAAGKEEEEEEEARGEASAPALYIDYESDRLAKENSGVVRGRGNRNGGSGERAEDEDKGC